MSYLLSHPSKWPLSVMNLWVYGAVGLLGLWCFVGPIPSARAQSSAACGLSGTTVLEDFTSTTFYDRSSFVEGWPAGLGRVRLPRKAGGFPNPSLSGRFDQRVVALTGADMDMDGDVDILTVIDTPSCQVHYWENNGAGTFTPRGQVASCMGVAGLQLVQGDVDGDGRPDLVLASVNAPNQAGLVQQALLLLHQGMVAGKPSLQVVDFTSLMTTAGVAWHTQGTPMALADWDGDGRSDLLVFHSTGTTHQILRFANTVAPASGGFQSMVQVLVPQVGLQTPIANNISTAPGGAACMPSLGISKGGSVLIAIDANDDGALDLVTGSVSETTLQVFMRQTDGSLLRGSDIAFPAGGAQFGFAADMDNNGSQDLVLVRGGQDCGDPSSQAWIIYNNGLGSFQLSQTKLSLGRTSQFAAVFDVDRDADRTPDVLAGRLTQLGQYRWYRNTTSTNVFSLRGRAISRARTTHDPEKGIVSALLAIRQNLSGSATIVYEVSNNNGTTWETLSADEIAGSKEHDFRSFGSVFRWRATLLGEEANLGGSPEEPYAPGTRTSPRIIAFQATLYTVSKRWYSRSSSAYGRIQKDGKLLEVRYDALFEYPGFRSKLFARDISVRRATGVGDSFRNLAGDSNVGLLWEAGGLLASKAESSRVLYTGVPILPMSSDDPRTIALQRVDFSSGEMVSPTTTPSLANTMGIGGWSVAERMALMSFVRGGFGDSASWKLFGIDHSSPLFVGAPIGSAEKYGTSYQAFMSTQANRPPNVYVGGNDGFVHAFNGITGEERWAYAPYNLLSKMSQLQDKSSGTSVYNPQTMVDGGLSYADVQDSGQWRTILVGGQGAGSAIDGHNYIYALDVTDSTNPKVLWEFTDRRGTSLGGCNVNDRCVPQCSATCSLNTASCYSQCNAYDSLFQISTSTPGADGGPAGLIEAERFDSLLGGSIPASSSWSEQPGPLSSTGLPPVTTSSNGYMQASGSGNALCPTGSTSNVSPCSPLGYRFTLQASGTYTPWLRLYPVDTSDNDVSVGIDGVFLGQVSGDISLLAKERWQWHPAPSVALAAGEHTLQIWLRDGAFKLDQVAIQTTSSTSPPGTLMPTCALTCDESCSVSCGAPLCSIGPPSSVEWPQCGVGRNLQCCGSSGGDGYCAPVGTCPAPESVMGETWSKPALGRMRTTAGPVWLVFFASGYRTTGSTTPNVGRSVYAVHAVTGRLVAQWDVGDVPFDSSSNPSTIDNTVPGSVTLVDTDGDYFVDRLYVGDLEGRLWKIALGNTLTIPGTGLIASSQVPHCVLFDAGMPNGTLPRTWAPIITKPGVIVLDSGHASDPNLYPVVYFGTGGDDRAPDTLLYRFYAIQDNEGPASCRATPKYEADLQVARHEWIVGDGKLNDGSGTPGVARAEGDVGDRYWSDPLVLGKLVYFISTPGKIESVNPCLNSVGTSKVYGYATTQVTNTLGGIFAQGASVFRSTTGTVLPWLDLGAKARSGPVATLLQGDGVVHGGGNNNMPAGVRIQFNAFNDGTGSTTGQAGGKELGAPAEKLTIFKILRWREVP